MTRSAARLDMIDTISRKAEDLSDPRSDTVASTDEREKRVREIVRLVRANRYEFESKLPFAVRPLLLDIVDVEPEQQSAAAGMIRRGWHDLVVDRPWAVRTRCDGRATTRAASGLVSPGS